MTVLVGFLPEKGGRAALDLAARLARSAGESLTVASVVPRPWSTPSLARVDAEFAAWAQERGTSALDAARAHLAATAPDLSASYETVTGASVGVALAEAAGRVAARLLVLGSSSDGGHGQVVVGSTADRLLHSSPVAVALAPRGYRAPAGATVRRVTCSYAGDRLAREVLALTAGLTAEVGASLRLATFGVRGRTMYPPEIGVGSEDDVLAQWVAQARAEQDAALDEVRTRHPGLAVDAAVGTGRSWTEALDDVEWTPDEVLVVGSTAGAVERVFLGSRASKIVRHSPVPVVAVPAAVARTAEA